MIQSAPAFSVIIPVYNRPSEVNELLESLAHQSFKNFEVVIVEDGSSEKSEMIVGLFKDLLNIKYYFKQNSGPGLTRNFGAENASADYFIFFDSDCIIPQNYFEIIDLSLKQNFLDCYGGPDRAHPSFSSVQKAINYSMTSFFTTGGIRGGKKKMDKFYPRSFNMGFSKDVFITTGGFSKMRFGEDVEFSIRVIKNEFITGLISEAFVFHKRRTNLRKFFRQVYNSGIARINLFKRHPESLKLVHLLPAAFVSFSILLFLMSFFKLLFIFPLLFFCLLIFSDSLLKNKSISVAFISIFAAFIQLLGYGSGFIHAFWKRLIFKDKEFYAFSKNFYK
jgi:glycosyltransferase involved in cell wall biosynthesis